MSKQQPTVESYLKKLETAVTQIKSRQGVDARNVQVVQTGDVNYSKTVPYTSPGTATLTVVFTPDSGDATYSDLNVYSNGDGYQHIQAYYRNPAYTDRTDKASWLILLYNNDYNFKPFTFNLVIDVYSVSGGTISIS